MQSIIAATLIFCTVILLFIGASFIGAIVEPEFIPNALNHIFTWIFPVGFWTITSNIVWLTPVLIYIPFQFRVIEYSVKAETGETMPEVYVKRGVVAVTRKHVPFRTITNISSKAGPFDRLFGIGSVHIGTAGYSGSQQQGCARARIIQVKHSLIM